MIVTLKTHNIKERENGNKKGSRMMIPTVSN